MYATHINKWALQSLVSNSSLRNPSFVLGLRVLDEVDISEWMLLIEHSSSLTSLIFPPQGWPRETFVIWFTCTVKIIKILHRKTQKNTETWVDQCKDPATVHHVSDKGGVGSWMQLALVCLVLSSYNTAFEYYLHCFFWMHRGGGCHTAGF